MKEAREILDNLTKMVGRADVNIDFDELRERLGDLLQRVRRERLVVEERGTERFVEGLVLGLVVGAALAILLTPRSGPEIRRQLATRGVELKGKAEGVTGRAGSGPTVTRTAVPERS